MSPFDEADWPPIRVLAWVWLRGRTVVDDRNLTTLRLGIPIGPTGLDLDRVPIANRLALMTLRDAHDKIRAASRSGQLPWTGRFARLRARQVLPVLAFVEGVMDYDTALLAGPVPGYQIWHALRAERTRVLDLWPETSAVVSPQSAQPPLRRSDRQVVDDYIAAEEQAGRIPQLSRVHQKHADRSLKRLRAAWPHDRYPLKRGRPKKI